MLGQPQSLGLGRASVVHRALGPRRQLVLPKMEPELEFKGQETVAQIEPLGSYIAALGRNGDARGPTGVEPLGAHSEQSVAHALSPVVSVNTEQ